MVKFYLHEIGHFSTSDLASLLAGWAQRIVGLNKHHKVELFHFHLHR